MPGFYLLTIFNYFIVVPASGELLCTCGIRINKFLTQLDFTSVGVYLVQINNNVKFYSSQKCWYMPLVAEGNTLLYKFYFIIFR